jgi:hypothetical protein
MSPEFLDRFHTMQTQMDDYLAGQNTTTEDDAAIAQYLIVALILSYGVAALFQAIRLIVVVAVAYSLIQFAVNYKQPVKKGCLWLYLDSGLCAGFLALMISLAVYWLGWPVNVFSMAMLALPVWGIGLMIKRWRSQPNNIRQLSGSLASWMAVFVIAGAMY